MARITIILAIFLIWMNLTAVALTDSGVCDQWDTCPDSGGDDLVSEANTTAVNATQESGAQTLFGMFTSTVGDFVDVGILLTIGGPMMFRNLGFPTWLVGFTFGPVYLVVAADIVSMLTGRDTL